MARVVVAERAQANLRAMIRTHSLPATTRERVRAAIEASLFEFPRRRVVLNLSPANVRKEGTGMDLAMALAILQLGSAEPIEAPLPGENERLIVAWGELGLDGRVKPSAQVTRTLMAATIEVRTSLASNSFL